MRGTAWIQAPNFVAVNGTGRMFAIRVDPSQLEPGFHAGEIAASLKDRVVFRIPVAVAKPERLAGTDVTYRHPKTAPGQMQRHYVAVPAGATWAELTVTSAGNATPLQHWIHISQLLPLRRLP